MRQQRAHASAIHLSVRSFQKAYGGYVAVHDVSLDVHAGEFIALLGPSGCGKTTLLRAIAGLVAPTSGDILIDGSSILGIPAHRRGVGMVFQSYALFPHMTVEQNTAFGLRMNKVPRDQIARDVRDALRLVRLDELGDRYPHQLSGGQQQRVAVARAIATKPKVLLLDEPLAALDAKLREAMRIELTQLQRRLGLTTIFVTHDQHEALAMADRIAVVRGGRIEQFDAPKQLYHNPASAFVADFVGQMNRVDGTVIGREEGGSRVLASGSLFEFDARPIASGVGNAVTAMVRPERMVICDPRGEPANGVNRLNGVIAATMFAGESTQWVVRTPVADLVASHQDSAARQASDYAIGSEVSIEWNPQDTHVFARA